jgi:hypothetical protein
VFAPARQRANETLDSRPASRTATVTALSVFE